VTGPYPLASPPDWAALLAAARAGSADALGRLLDAVRPYLLAVAGAALDPDLRAKAGASDLVQESLLEGQRDFEQFPGHRPDELRAWLVQILHNNVANFRRQFRDAAMRNVAREVPLPEPWFGGQPGEQLADDSTSPSGKAADREERERFFQALARLPEFQREVIVWHHRDGLEFAVIGDRLGRTPEAARQLWWRALRRLKQELGECP
jgi:RNA polymerase sigma-70 factor (ECF subfamily)